MPRGRPPKSEIRQNIIEILFYMGEGHGYNLARVYNEIFPAVTQRSIYYHLKKGVNTGEFLVHSIRKETGEFSWGQTVEKIYYTLGNQANPRGDKRVEEYLKKYKWKEHSKEE